MNRGLKRKYIRTVTVSKITSYDEATNKMLSEKETASEVTTGFFEANDGSLYLNPNECSKQNIILAGNAVKCPRCKGIGYKLEDTWEGKDEKINCRPCGGSGIIYLN